MIYTVTVNPSLDYVMNAPSFEKGRINKSSSERIYPGGKGLNVSIMLHNLGVESTALGFCAGFSGERICTLIGEHGIAHRMIMLDDGCSRINVKIRSAEETDINANGPDIAPLYIEKLTKYLSDTLTADDILVLAGSIPKSVGNDLYAHLMECTSSTGVKYVVDASGQLLLSTLAHRPFLIKPNLDELSELAGCVLDNDDDILSAAQSLIDKDARNVLVSLGADGAMLLSEDGKRIKMKAPTGRTVNTVAAGDSMVAGFLAGYISSQGDYISALKKGIAAGSATAFTEWIADADAVKAIEKALIY